MKSKFTSLVLAVCISANAFSQGPIKQWDARFGGSGEDWLWSLIQTKDGGYLFGGYSSSGASGDKTQPSQGGIDYWIVKTDENGVKQWDARFGGNGDDYLYSVIQTSDSGYLLGGTSNSGISGDRTQDSRGFNDVWLVKTDMNGIKQWDVRFGGNLGDWLSSVRQTSDGGFILGTYTRSGANGDVSDPIIGSYDYWIVKTDGFGNKQWDHRFGGADIEYLSSIMQTSDNGYILGGTTFSDKGFDVSDVRRGNQDYWIIKVDSNGLKQWDARFGGNLNNSMFDVAQTVEGGYLLVGYSDSPASDDKTEPAYGVNNSDYWVVKIDANGEKEWDKIYGTYYPSNAFGDACYSIKPTLDGNYILGGFSGVGADHDRTEPSNGGFDYWIVKINPQGEKLWDKSFGGSLNDEFGYTISSADGSYVVGGISISGISGDKSQASEGGTDYWIVKTVSEEESTCDIPTGLFTSNIKSTLSKVNWDIAPNAQTYSVRYRKTGTVPWTKTTAQLNYKKLTGLSPNTQYDWSVKSVCDPVTNFSSDWSATQNFTTKPLRLENENDEEEILLEIFPNPVSSTATISISLNEDSKLLIELFSMDGKKLMTIANENFSEGNQEIEFTRKSLVTGIYFLQIQSNEGVAVQKVVIE